MSKFILSLFALFLLFFFTSCNAYKIRNSYSKGHVHQEAFLEEVSFETYRNWMILEVRINDYEEPFRFLYDTGAPNVITPQAAEKLGLKSFAKGKVSDSQRRRSTLSFAKLKAVHIGSITFENTSAIIASLDAVPELECPNFDGFIGANLMRLAKWEINYETKKMIFTNDRNKLTTPSNGFSIPFTTSRQGSPFIQVTLTDSVTQKFELDTGKEGGIDITRSVFLEKMKYLPHYDNFTVYGMSGAGLYGASQDTFSVVYLDSIKLGELPIYNQNFSVESKTSHLLGMDILKNYHMLLDWEKKEAILTPFHGDSNKNETVKRSFGFSTSFQDNQLKVVSLIQDAPAEKAGILIDDQVLQIDDANYEQMVLQDFCKFGEVNDIEKDSILIKIRRKDKVFEHMLHKQNVVQKGIK